MSEKIRQCALDTETTGISVRDKHRVIEIGIVELVDRKITGNTFHCYLNPERAIDQGAEAVHGISLSFLQDKPKFFDVCQDFLNFIDGAELLIHNAPFDVGFLDYEMQLLGKSLKVSSVAKVLDTLVLARKKYPGQKNNLDALCRRLGVDLSKRDVHGALLDAELLSQVYLAMTASQGILFDDESFNKRVNKALVLEDAQIIAMDLLPEELLQHQKYLAKIKI